MNKAKYVIEGFAVVAMVADSTNCFVFAQEKRSLRPTSRGPWNADLSSRPLQYGRPAFSQLTWKVIILIWQAGTWPEILISARP